MNSHLKNKTALILIETAAISIIIPMLSNLIVNFTGAHISGHSLTKNLFLNILFYVLQAGAAILIVKYIMGYSIPDMGFNFKNWKITIDYLKGFVVIWLILDILFYFVCLNFVPHFDTYIANYYVKDKSMLIKELIGGCLLAGLGEEPLFRGLVVIMLSSVITKQINIWKVKLPLTALLSGVLFMIAHIGYQIYPFRIISIDYLQLLFTFILGTFWATLFIKTKSLTGPILAHSLANTIQIMSGYITAFFFLK